MRCSLVHVFVTGGVYRWPVIAAFWNRRGLSTKKRNWIDRLSLGGGLRKNSLLATGEHIWRFFLRESLREKKSDVKIHENVLKMMNKIKPLFIELTKVIAVCRKADHYLEMSRCSQGRKVLNWWRSSLPNQFESKQCQNKLINDVLGRSRVRRCDGRT